MDLVEINVEENTSHPLPEMILNCMLVQKLRHCKELITYWWGGNPKIWPFLPTEGSGPKKIPHTGDTDAYLPMLSIF